jgi:FKBP12-rapamycin complex-associated protein
MRTCDESLRETFFQVFWQIVAIVKQHVRQYLDGIFELVIEYWDKEHLLPHILTLVEEMSLALPDQFKGHLAELIPKLLGILNGDKSEKREPTLRYDLPLISAHSLLILSIIL